MDIKQAFDIVRQVCELHNGNWQTHQQIQQAMKVLVDFVNEHLEEVKE